MGNLPSATTANAKQQKEISSKKPPELNAQLAGELFDDLDIDKTGYLTLKQFLNEKASAPSHSLPALFFCDIEKNGRITKSEFLILVQCCLLERKKVKAVLLKDKSFRELIQKASAAGVRDSSGPCRTSFRRLSSFRDVRSVYCRPAPQNSEKRVLDTGRPPKHGRPPKYPGPPTTQVPCSPVSSALSRTRSVPMEMNAETMNVKVDLEGRPDGESGAHTTDVLPGSYKSKESLSLCDQPNAKQTSRCSLIPSATVSMPPEQLEYYEQVQAHENDMSDPSSMTDESIEDNEECECASEDDEDHGEGDCRTISMMSSRMKYSPNGEVIGEEVVPTLERCKSEDLEPASITALDAAVVENVMKMHISKLADMLHTETVRIQFMQWLWKLVDYNSKGFVGLEELRTFCDALNEDGIGIEELAFYKNPGVPLEQRLLNEFDTTHRGYLKKMEFLSFADLVTREYEFWECRHLDRIGNYELGRTIGRGSSAIVRAAFNIETKENYAMKVVKKGTIAELNRLDTEIQALMQLKHPNIAALVEVMESHDRTFLVQELCGGGSLIDMVRVYPEEKMPEDTARYYVRQLFEALAYCHEHGVCHRDVRPENMLLDNSGNLKLVDFGHSGIYNCGWDVFSTNLVGALFNLSPEQVMGQPYSGEKIDVWSAGVAVYCLLVGRPPFCDADTNRLVESILAGSFAIPETVSREAADLLRRTIQVDSGMRPTMTELLHHPWFFSGPEIAPIMNVINIPVDPFFIRRPDIAEMVIARNIHHYNIHFHLGINKGFNKGPADAYVRDWALKCQCAQMDIKFCVSLITQDSLKGTNAKALGESLDQISNPRMSLDLDTFRAVALSETMGESLNGKVGDSRTSSGALGEYESDGQSTENNDWVEGSEGGEEAGITRSRSLDENLESLLSIKRSATFDVFPYQRTLPQRRRPLKLPEFVQRNFLDDTTLYMSRRSRRRQARRARRKSRKSSDVNTAAHGENVSITNNHSGSSDEDHVPEANDSIKKHLSIHPSKAARYLTSTMHDVGSIGADSAFGSPVMSPKSPVRRVQEKESLHIPKLNLSGRDSTPNRVTLGSPRKSAHSGSWSCFDVVTRNLHDKDFHPFLELRLNKGESGLFLKICRKVKTICETELTATAETHKRKEAARRSPLLKRVNSLKTM